MISLKAALLGGFALLASLPHIAEAQEIDPTCLDYSKGDQFDYQMEPFWLNRRPSMNEGRFAIDEVGEVVLADFVQTLGDMGTQVHFLALPDASLFMPQGPSADPLLAGRFMELYQDLNIQMEDLGFVAIDMSWLATQGRFEVPVHRTVDHHLTSRGRFYLSAQISRGLEGRRYRANVPALEAEYARLESEVYQVWQPTAGSYVIEDCLELVEDIAVDERVELPRTAGAQATEDSLFGDMSDTPQIVLAGTSQGLSADGNLADFIKHFSGQDVVNYSEAGGGAATSLQFAGLEGRFVSDRTPHLIWEVSREHNQELLVGGALAAQGMAFSGCEARRGVVEEPDAMEVNPNTWAELDLRRYPADRVLSIAPNGHEQGKILIRYEFPDNQVLDAEIWRWSQTRDLEDLGDWQIYMPDFEALGLEAPDRVLIRQEGLYEYQPAEPWLLEARVCKAEIS